MLDAASWSAGAAIAALGARLRAAVTRGHRGVDESRRSCGAGARAACGCKPVMLQRRDGPALGRPVGRRGELRFTDETQENECTGMMAIKGERNSRSTGACRWLAPIPTTT